MMVVWMLMVIIFIRGVMRVVVVGLGLSLRTRTCVPARMTRCGWVARGAGMAIASMRPWATGYAGDKDKDEGPAKSYIVGEFGRLIKEGYIDPVELAVVRPVKVLVRAGVVLEAW